MKFQCEYCFYHFCTLGKIKKATKARSKTSEARQAGGRNWCRESTTVSNEDRNFKPEMLVVMATIRYVQQIIFMKIIYSISARWMWFSSAKMIIIIIKLTKNLPINSPVQRKIPTQNVLVDCIHVNGLSMACQSEGKVLFPVKTKNSVFSAIILYFSVFLRLFCRMRNRSLVGEREFTRSVDRSVGRSIGRSILGS